MDYDKIYDDISKAMDKHFEEMDVLIKESDKISKEYEKGIKTFFSKKSAPAVIVNNNQEWFGYAPVSNSNLFQNL